MASGKTTRAAKHPDQVRDSYAKAADHGPNDEGSRFHPASVERSGQAYRNAKACPPPGKGTPFRIGIEDGVSEACDDVAVEKRIQVRAPVVAFPAVSVQASDDRGIGRRPPGSPYADACRRPSSPAGQASAGAARAAVPGQSRPGRPPPARALLELGRRFRPGRLPLRIS